MTEAQEQLATEYIIRKIGLGLRSFSRQELGKADKTVGMAKLWPAMPLLPLILTLFLCV